MLKTAGFDIEVTDIASPAVMERFAAAATLASVTIIQLVQDRGGDTDDLLARVFAAEDRAVLEAVCPTLDGKTVRQRVPHLPDSLAYATLMARLGGWTGDYGKPGPQMLRRGLDIFHAVKLGAFLRRPYLSIRSPPAGRRESPRQIFPRTARHTPGEVEARAIPCPG